MSEPKPARRHVELKTHPTTAPQFDAAFAVLKRVGAWLESKGRRQRIADTTRESYAAWQSDGCNHVVLCDDTIVGVFTLCRETLTTWEGVAPSHPVLFLRALATDPDWHGCGVGAFGIATAVELAAPEAVWLDCVSDFLPSYYEQQGFHRIDRRIVCSGEDQAQPQYDVTLMRSQLITHPPC